MNIEDARWSAGGGYEGLESIAQDIGDEAMSILAEHVEAGGELIDRDFELERPDLIEYTTLLARALDYELTPEVCEAAYRAAHYAYLVSEQFLEHPAIVTPPYFSDPEELPETRRERILRDTQTYLQNRPMLDAFIGKHMPELDPSARYATLVETVGALVFLQIEIHEKSQFVEETLGDFSLALAGWDGDLEAVLSAGHTTGDA